MTNNDKKLISRCLLLAQNGLGNVAPNPMVGAVIVYNNKIIGEGYHQKFGEAHAEVNAINSVKDKSLLQDSTIYVNLEPCAHYGKTPPCADYIVQHGIPRVVIGTVDPFAKVAGKGIEILKNAGCQVKVGVLEKECYELNKRFFKFHEQKKPYIILKWAQTIDGFIDIKREKNFEAKPTWITEEQTRVLVHKWRSEEDAIMVGTETAIKDNPSLTTRDWKGKNPTRLLLDKDLRVQQSFKLYNNEAKTIVFTQQEAKNDKNIEYCRIDFEKNIIDQILHILYKKNIQSIIVEGGRMLLQSFINSNQWDEAKYFIGSKKFNEGIEAPKIQGKLIYDEPIGKDSLIILKKRESNECYF